MIERGEITEMQISSSRSVETINSQGQHVAGKKPGLPEYSASITYRVGQDQDQWGRLLVGPPFGHESGRRRVRPERFTMLLFMHDREVAHAGKRVIKLTDCFVSDADIPGTAVDERELTATATIQIGDLQYIEHFNKLPPGEGTGAPQPLVLGRR
ncbi:MAG: hypothetical protein FWG64_10030 [Firmicutes bacterium]|nr:hypothetical protein [Bacillota bacterium]